MGRQRQGLVIPCIHQTDDTHNLTESSFQGHFYCPQYTICDSMTSAPNYDEYYMLNQYRPPNPQQFYSNRLTSYKHSISSNQNGFSHLKTTHYGYHEQQHRTLYSNNKSGNYTAMMNHMIAAGHVISKAIQDVKANLTKAHSNCNLFHYSLFNFRRFAR